MYCVVTLNITAEVDEDEPGIQIPTPDIEYNLGKLRSLINNILYDKEITVHSIQLITYDQQTSQAATFEAYITTKYSLSKLQSTIQESLDDGGDSWMESDITANGFVVYEGKIYLSLYDYKYDVQLVNIQSITQSITQPIIQPITQSITQFTIHLPTTRSTIKLDQELSPQVKPIIITEPILLILDYSDSDWILLDQHTTVSVCKTAPFADGIVSLLDTCDIYQIGSYNSYIKIVLRINTDINTIDDLQSWFLDQLTLEPQSITINQPFTVDICDWTNCR
jgi:hypothetical protein